MIQCKLIRHQFLNPTLHCAVAIIRTGSLYSSITVVSAKVLTGLFKRALRSGVNDVVAGCLAPAALGDVGDGVRRLLYTRHSQDACLLPFAVSFPRGILRDVSDGTRFIVKGNNRDDVGPGG